MKNFFIKLKVLAELILTFSGIYAAIVFSFSSLLVNLLLIVVSLFILSQALGTIDELNGYNNKSAGFPVNKHNAGFPVNNHNHTGFPSTGFPDNHHYPDYDTGIPDDEPDSESTDDELTNTDDLNDNDYPEIPE